jgi:hypothetical protein
MFTVLKLGDWSGVGGTCFYRLCDNGLDAIRERERLGLPSETTGSVAVCMESIVDRRAAESWPEALNCDADLPLAVLNNKPGCEVHALVAAGLIAFSGPIEVLTPNRNVGLRLTLTCTPFELVQWRRAWAAEQETISLRAKLAAAEQEPETLANEHQHDESD